MCSLPLVNLCRLCLCSGGKLMDIFKDNETIDFVVQDVVEDLLHIQVKKPEKLPWLICSSCLGKLIEFRYFKIRCLECKFTFESRYSGLERISGDPLEIDVSDVPRAPNWYGESSGCILKEDIKHEDSDECISDAEFSEEPIRGVVRGVDPSSPEKCVGELVFLRREAGDDALFGERYLIRTVGTASSGNGPSATEKYPPTVPASSSSNGVPTTSQTASSGVLAAHSSVPQAHGNPTVPSCLPIVPCLPTVPYIPPLLPGCAQRRHRKGRGKPGGGRCDKCKDSGGEKGCCEMNHGSDDEDDDVWLSGPKRKRAALQRWYWELEKLRSKSEQEKINAEEIRKAGLLPVATFKQKDDSVPKASKKSSSVVEGQWQGGIPRIVNVASTIYSKPPVKKTKKGVVPSTSSATPPGAGSTEKSAGAAKSAHEFGRANCSLISKVGNTACIRVSGDSVGGRSAALIEVLKKINAGANLDGGCAVSQQRKAGEGVVSGTGKVEPIDKNAKDGGVGVVSAKTELGAVPIPGTNAGNNRVVMVMKRTKGSATGDAEYKVACGLSKDMVNVSLEFVPEPEETETVAQPSLNTAKDVNRAERPLLEHPSSSHAGGENVGGNASEKDKMAAATVGYPKRKENLEVCNATEYGFTLKRMEREKPIHLKNDVGASRTMQENKKEGHCDSSEKVSQLEAKGGITGSKDQVASPLNGKDNSGECGYSLKGISIKGVKSMACVGDEASEGTPRNSRDNIRVVHPGLDPRINLSEPNAGKGRMKSMKEDKALPNASQNGKDSSGILDEIEKDFEIKDVTGSKPVIGEGTSVKLKKRKPYTGKRRFKRARGGKASLLTAPRNGEGSSSIYVETKDGRAVEDVTDSIPVCDERIPVIAEKRKRGRPCSSRTMIRGLARIDGEGGASDRVDDVSHPVGDASPADAWAGITVKTEKDLKVEDVADSTPACGEGTPLFPGKRKRGRPRGSRWNRCHMVRFSGEGVSSDQTGDVTSANGERRSGAGRPRGSADREKRSRDRQIDVFAGKLVYRSVRGRIVQQAKDTAPVYVEAGGRMLKDTPRKRREKKCIPDAKSQPSKPSVGVAEGLPASAEVIGGADEPSLWSEEKSWDSDSSEGYWEQQWHALKNEEAVCTPDIGVVCVKTDLDARKCFELDSAHNREDSVGKGKDVDGRLVPGLESGHESKGAPCIISPECIKKEVEDDGEVGEGSTALVGDTEGLASVLLENGVRANAAISPSPPASNGKVEGQSSSASTTVADAGNECVVGAETGGGKGETDMPSEDHDGASNKEGGDSSSEGVGVEKATNWPLPPRDKDGTFTTMKRLAKKQAGGFKKKVAKESDSQEEEKP